MRKSQSIINSLVSEIYKGVFYLNFSNNKLKFKSETLSENLTAIIEFLGLCYTRYRGEFKSLFEIYEFVKESHYFNIDYFKNKGLIKHCKEKPKRKQYDYLLRKRIIISEEEYKQVSEKHLIQNINNQYSIRLVDYRNHNLQDKYKNIEFKEDIYIYLDSLRSFFQKF